MTCRLTVNKLQNVWWSDVKYNKNKCTLCESNKFPNFQNCIGDRLIVHYSGTSHTGRPFQPIWKCSHTGQNGRYENYWSSLNPHNGRPFGRYERWPIWEMTGVSVAGMRNAKFLKSHNGQPVWEVPLYFLGHRFEARKLTYANWTYIANVAKFCSQCCKCFLTFILEK